ncbi:MAG: ATP-binding protein [Cyclobacteriaceae bacterium]|nr:ATP-binding protein [Cyclobacteriaceae bacterium]
MLGFRFLQYVAPNGRLVKMELYGIEFRKIPYIAYMIKRELEQKLVKLARTFKTVALIGARQTGKTTLVKSVFKDKEYVTLENPTHRAFAMEDPNGFLASYKEGAIFDEIQRVPHLFSYLQEIIDSSTKKGQFILTGSNNFLLQQNISQSLAGRVGILNLMPFSINELNNADLLIDSDNSLMLNGFYPPIYDQHIPPIDWCPNYIQTYIERDVRQIKNVTDLIVFERFIKLLAGRNGQELNMSSFSNEVGVDMKTIQSWIGILESSSIIYLLRAYHKNYNKTIIKRPKLYFIDTALVCFLLGIKSEEHLQSHPLRGHIFEGLVVTELIKQRVNKGARINLFYWRDKTGHEIDIIVDSETGITPIEIKSGMTISSDYFKNLRYWNKISNVKSSIVLYAGNQKQNRSDGISVLNWRSYFV